MGRIANICWEGLTLKHVSHPKVIKPYLLFISTALLLELFLLILFAVSCFIFYDYGLAPESLYYISGVIIVLMLVITVSILKTTISRFKTMM